MMRVLKEFGGRDLLKLCLYLQRCLTGSKASPIGYPKDMGIDGDGRQSEGDVEDNIGRLAPNTSQLLEGFSIGGYLPVMLIQKLLGHELQILCLGIEQADRLDVVANALFPKGQHLRWCVGDLE